MPPDEDPEFNHLVAQARDDPTVMPDYMAPTEFMGRLLCGLFWMAFAISSGFCGALGVFIAATKTDTTHWPETDAQWQTLATENFLFAALWGAVFAILTSLGLRGLAFWSLSRREPERHREWNLRRAFWLAMGIWALFLAVAGKMSLDLYQTQPLPPEPEIRSN